MHLQYFVAYYFLCSCFVILGSDNSSEKKALFVTRDSKFSLSSLRSVDSQGSFLEATLWPGTEINYSFPFDSPLISPSSRGSLIDEQRSPLLSSSCHMVNSSQDYKIDKSGDKQGSVFIFKVQPGLGQRVQNHTQLHDQHNSWYDDEKCYVVAGGLFLCYAFIWGH